MLNHRNHLLALCLVLLAACARAAAPIDLIALSSLAQQGRHHELIGVLAPLVEEGEDIPSFPLMMLGGAYHEVGKYRQADETAGLLEKRIRAGDTTQFGGDLSVYPEIIRGAVALDQGLYDEAIRHAGAAMDRLKDNQIFFRSQLIQIGNTLGIALALTGEKEAARQILERIRAVNLARSILGPEKFTAMARIQLALRDYPQALLSITDPRAEVGPRLTAHYDPTFQNLPRHFIRAKSLFETGRTEEAKRGYDELLRHPQISQYGTLYWIVLSDRARIALGEGDLSLATELLKRAIEIIEQRRSSIASEAGRIGFTGDKQVVYGQLVGVLLKQNRADEALEFVERAKSRALVDMLAAKSDFAVRGATAEQARRALADIDDLDRTALEKEAVPSVGDSPRTRNLAIAHEHLAQAMPELATLVSVAATSTWEFAHLLPADEPLVEYFHSRTELHAFVVKDGRARAVQLEENRLEADVQALRDALEHVDSDAWQAIASRLHERLWQPLEGLLGGARRVLIVPHGVLHYLPFSVLRGADGMPLVERFGTRFLPSASVLEFLRHASAAPRASLLVLGNPDLGDPGLDLKFADEEARAVSRLYPGARLLLRREASETNLRKAGPAFRRLHIASHGRFRADAPLTSGLYLARDADNDGTLTVGELYSMNLDTDLVTLSACETGLGKIVNGDDIVGLGRGFLYAGARSIVASLWRVDDRATARLMRAFYRNLATMDTLEALRQAQLSTRRNFPHPFFWAAFQLTGMED